MTSVVCPTLFPPGKAGETEKKPLRTVRCKADDVSKAVSKLLNVKATVRYKTGNVSKAG